MDMKVILIFSILLISISDNSALTEDAAICKIATEFSKSYSYFSGWICNDSIPITHVCNGDNSNWEGISCTSGKISSLALPYYYISGNIPVAIGYLTNLASLDLSFNYFTGTLPYTFCYLTNLNVLLLYSNYLSGTIPSCIGQLQKINYLYLMANYFSGPIPSSIGLLTNMYYLFLQYPNYYPYNQFTGTIPSSIGFLSSIIYLYLHDNLLTGTLPESISKLSNLQYLLLNYNYFTGKLPTLQNTALKSLYINDNYFTGALPTSFGLLTNITDFYCHNNLLTGTLPSSLSNLKYLYYLIISNNLFSGSIPSAFGKLKILNLFYLQYNKITGTIPTTIVTMTNLQYVYSYYNSLSGPIPNNIHLLSKLTYFYIAYNQLTHTIPTTISYLTNLLIFDCSYNHITGTIPNSIGNLTNLLTFTLSQNCLIGTIPTTIGYLTNVNRFFLNFNKLSGTIPSEFGLLSSLVNSEIGINSLTGTIPSNIGYLSKLIHLAIDGTCLIGTIPSSIGKLESLQDLVFTSNCLTGTIPSTIGQMSSLMILYLYSNSLSGRLPSEIGKLKSLQFIDLYNNSLTGSIPTTVGNMTDMILWTMNNNHLTGSIPTSIGYLTNLESLYLASNRLTGSLPASLGKLIKLSVLDLSVNYLSQTVPSSFQQLRLITELYLRGNKLSGQLSSFINITTWTVLINIDISSNTLSGTLPSGSFLNNSNLRIFAATDNCIEVMIPTDFCLAKNLQILALDGLASASKCQHRFFPHTTTTTYTLAKQLSRNIPSCLFSMSKLSILHLSGNALTGTFPDTLTLGSALQDMTLSYNRLEGTISLEIQSRQWKQLDLSYNSFSGTLSHDIRTNNATKYSLKINRLSGIIPTGLRKAPTISILQGNIFQCNFNTRELPREDEDNQSYRCGSDTFYLALYIFFGMFLLLLLLRYLIMSAGFSLRQIYLLLYYHNGVGDFSLLVQKLCRLVLLMSLLFVCILMPIYGTLSVFYGTHTFQYGWSVSAGFLSGNVPTITLLMIWILILLTFHIMQVWLIKGNRKQESECSTSQINNNNDNNDNNNQQDLVMDYMDTASVKSLAIEQKIDVTSVGFSGWSKSVLAILIIVDVAVIFGANAGYVYATLGASSGATIIFLQIVLGVFKAIWFKVYICNLNNMVTIITGHTSQQKQEVTFLTIVLIINNVFLPLLAEVAVDSNCIYNILVSPATIGTSYSYAVCAGKQWGICYDYAYVTALVEFTPPFMYRYQCSPIVITNYVSVYVYMFLFLAIQLPFSAIIVKCRNLFHNEKSFGFRLFHYLSHRLHKLPPSFSTSIYLSVMISNLSILMTFGMVYPPLAALILLSVISDMYFTIQQIDQLQPEIIDEVISLEVLGIVRYLLPFSAIFLAFFLYDISEALWAPLVLACMPIVIYLFAYLQEYTQMRKYQKRVLVYDQPQQNIIN